MVVGPAADLLAIATWPAVAVGSTPIGFLEEHLIVTFEVVLEDDALDTSAFLGEAIGRPQVGAIQVRVVHEFALSRRTVMERLPWVVVRSAMRFEQLAPTLGQRHEIGAALPIDGRDVPEEAFRSEMREIPVPQVGRPLAVVTEVGNRDDAEGSNGRERADFRATQVVPFVAERDGLTIEVAWQVKALREDVAGIHTHHRPVGPDRARCRVRG